MPRKKNIRLSSERPACHQNSNSLIYRFPFSSYWYESSNSSNLVISWLRFVHWINIIDLSYMKKISVSRSCLTRILFKFIQKLAFWECILIIITRKPQVCKSPVPIRVFSMWTWTILSHRFAHIEGRTKRLLIVKDTSEGLELLAVSLWRLRRIIYY